MRHTYEVRLIVHTQKDETLDDIEWAVRDLFYDDKDGNPNFTIGAMVGIIAEKIKVEEDKD